MGNGEWETGMGEGEFEDQVVNPRHLRFGFFLSYDSLLFKSSSVFVD